MTRETRRQVRDILDEAARLKKPCACLEYEKMKARLLRCPLTAAEYERAIRALCRALEV